MSHHLVSSRKIGVVGYSLSFYAELPFEVFTMSKVRVKLLDFEFSYLDPLLLNCFPNLNQPSECNQLVGNCILPIVLQNLLEKSSNLHSSRWKFSFILAKVSLLKRQDACFALITEGNQSAVNCFSNNIQACLFCTCYAEIDKVALMYADVPFNLNINNDKSTWVTRIGHFGNFWMKGYW